MQRTKERELLIEKENALLDHKLGAVLSCCINSVQIL